MSRYHMHRRNIADGHPLQIYRLSRADALSVIKISNERDFLGKQPAGPAYEKNENGQRH